METIKAIEQRKSIRSYLDKDVEKADLIALASYANKAPSAGPIHISIVTDKELLKKIDDEAYDFMKNSGVEFMMQRVALEGYRPLYAAPAMMLISTADPDRGMPGVAAAATTVTIAATDMGLGSCYVASPTRIVNTPEYKALLNVPEGNTILAGVLLGYTDDREKYGRERIVGDNVVFVE